ncbi:MAG: hypothetical protein IJX81_00645 [Clostridia bacterium]|nr:hypothetical protein [Clostridia bacterium]
MATDLVGNTKLQRFIELLAELNHETAEVLKSGRTVMFERMNKTIEEMYSIQQNSTEDAYTAIEEDAQAIYKNFDAIAMMMNSNEGNVADFATNVAVKKFLHNIFDATVRIVTAYGLV